MFKQRASKTARNVPPNNIYGMNVDITPNPIFAIRFLLPWKNRPCVFINYSLLKFLYKRESKLQIKWASSLIPSSFLQISVMCQELNVLKDQSMYKKFSNEWYHGWKIVHIHDNILLGREESTHTPQQKKK